MSEIAPTVEDALLHCFGGCVVERADGELRIRYSGEVDENDPDDFIPELVFTEHELRRHLEILFRRAVDMRRHNPHRYVLREMSLDEMETTGTTAESDMPMRLIPGDGFLSEGSLRRVREGEEDVQSEWSHRWGEGQGEVGRDVMPSVEEALRHCFNGCLIVRADGELRIRYSGEADEGDPNDFVPEYLLTHDEMRRHIEFLSSCAQRKRKRNPRAYVLDRMLRNSRKVLRSSSKADMPVRLIPDEGFVIDNLPPPAPAPPASGANSSS